MPIIHVDMDAFFVSAELLRHPELRGKPLVVGGTGKRGVVAAASYEARAYGVTAAMPTAVARRLCPHATFMSGDHEYYSAKSRDVMELMRSFTPLVEPLSLDEAFLDVTGARRLFGDAVEIAHEIRRRVLGELGLSCSVGVATSKFLAKLASEAAKPSASPSGPIPGAGVFCVPAGGELEFLHPLPVAALWGVGPVTQDRLARLGVRTVGDLAALPESTLKNLLGRAAGSHLHGLARGIDERPVSVERQRRSMSQEVTFADDVSDHRTLELRLVEQADGLAARLRQSGMTGRTVTLKVRFGDFSTITRSSTQQAPVESAVALARTAKDLLTEVEVERGVRLLGIGVSGLDAGAPQQLSLDGVEPAWEELDGVVDSIRSRFGAGAIRLAAQTRPRSGPWGPDQAEK